MSKRCPKCGVKYAKNRKHHLYKRRHKSRHHVLPQRHFGSGGETYDICRGCHNQLELWITEAEKRHQSFGNDLPMPRGKYYAVFFRFMRLQ